MTGAVAAPPAPRSTAGHDGRPAFHLTAQRGWINDPHGIVHRDGQYHVFMQWVPEEVVWRVPIHWGHVVGDDLMSLRDTATVAIAPGDGDDGIWTGCVVEADGRTLAFYTSVVDGDLGRARIRVAEAEDAGLTRWRKGDVVVATPPGITAFRDPVVFRRDGTWWMTVGAELPDRAAALAWTSDDLEHWSAAGVVAERSAAATDPWTGTLWECPQVIAVDDTTDAMITSVWAEDVSYDTAWAVGHWEHAHFRVDSWSDLSHGRVHYAPSVFRDADDEPSVLFWLRDVVDPGAEWAGALSVPYRIERQDDRLRLALHPDVLRHLGDEVDGDRVEGPFVASWTGTAGDVLELTQQRDRDHAGDGAGDGDAGTSPGDVVRLRLTDEHCLVEAPHRDVVRIPRHGGPVEVVLDGTVVEVLTDGGVGGVVLPEAVATVHVDGADVEVRPLVH